MWQSLVNDVSTISKDVVELCETKLADKQVYMSLPRPGVSVSEHYILYTGV